MEDLLEEIVGDIQDEHDGEEAEDILRLGDDSYEFDGLVLLDEISELLNIEFDEPEEDTIGGLSSDFWGVSPKKVTESLPAAGVLRLLKQKALE